MKIQHQDQRVLVLFDVQNMYYSAKQLFGSKVNFKEILNKAVAGRKLIRAIAYVIKTEIKDEKNFHEALENIGIEVKAKELQIFYGGAKKGDWDIGIAMDAIRLSQKVDTVVIVSGDGDFKDLVGYLQSHGNRVEVIAFGRTGSIHLKKSADLFVDLEKDKGKILLRSKKPMVMVEDRKPRPKPVMTQAPPNLIREINKPLVSTKKKRKRPQKRKISDLIYKL